MTARNFYADTYLAPLSPKERVALAIVRQGPTSADYLIDHFDVTPRSIRTMMSRIRRKLAGTGWTVSRNDGGAATATAVYQVVPE